MQLFQVSYNVSTFHNVLLYNMHYILCKTIAYNLYIYIYLNFNYRKAKLQKSEENFVLEKQEIF